MPDTCPFACGHERGMPRAINLLYSLIINFLQRLVRWLSVMNFAHWKTSVRG